DLHATIDLGTLDRERWDELEAVVEITAPFEQEPFPDAVVEHLLALFGGRLPRGAVSYEFEPDEEALGVDPTEDRVFLLQFLEPLTEVGARGRRPLDDALRLVDVEGGVGRRSGEGRCGEGGDVRAGTPGGEDYVAADHGANGQAACE